MMDLELDREWTRLVAEHALRCGANLTFDSEIQDGFELVDQYCCRKCKKVLMKRASQDLPEDVSYSSRAVVNYKMGITLAKMDMVEEFSNMQRLANNICPTLEQLRELVASAKNDLVKQT